MSTENIVEKILSDARAEADEAYASAKAKAEESILKARQAAEEKIAQAQKAADAKAKDVADRKAASARLESAKIALAQKHRALDVVYEKALQSLICLDEERSLAMTDAMLKACAEEKDELYFAKSYPYADQVKLLPVIEEKKIKILKKNADVKGGMFLKGKTSDKDLSYETLLSDDKQENAGAVIAQLYERVESK